MLRIDANDIIDAESFHSVFATQFGFPAFYGRNMNAWIDCLSCLDDPPAGMTSVHVAPGQTLALVIDHAAGFKARCPELFTAFLECAGFVNWRCVEAGEAPLLAVALNG
ncbi:barstar family protein [Xanthomonas hortorum]|uniref:barstar family protein n=1 Tax=Xanthomonas hortorum TaxID=56454 RepID=UPI003D073B78